MRFKIVGYEPKDPKNYRIEYGYDRRQKLWIVQVFTDADVEVESVTIPKDWLGDIIKDFSTKYKTTEIRQI